MSPDLSSISQEIGDERASEANPAELWAVHTLGMDDLHPCASRVLAVRNATWLNLSLERALEDMGDESYPLIYNVPALWDGTPEGHTEALAASVAEDPRWSDLSADVIGDLARGVYAAPAPPTPEKAATVDREAVAGMTVAEVCDRRIDAVERGQETAGDSAELDYTNDLTVALDEELAELRAQTAELEKLREFARQVAALDSGEIGFRSVEKLVEVAGDLGQEVRS